MKDKKIFSILALVFGILSPAILILPGKSITVAMVIVIIGMIFAVASIVLGIIGLKGSKALSIIGMLISIISFGFLALSLVGFFAMSKAKDCVDLGNGNATCDLFGEPIDIPTTYLREDQMDKGE